MLTGRIPYVTLRYKTKYDFCLQLINDVILNMLTDPKYTQEANLCWVSLSETGCASVRQLSRLVVLEWMTFLKLFSPFYHQSYIYIFFFRKSHNISLKMDCVDPSPQENVRGRNEMTRYLMKNLVFCRMHNTWWRHKPSVIYIP